MTPETSPDTVTPAARMIARFGVENIARWTGRHRSRVHAWTWPSNRGGTGGVIPARSRQAIIHGAHRDHGEAVAWAEFEPMEGEVYLLDGAAASEAV